MKQGQEQRKLKEPAEDTKVLGHGFWEGTYQCVDPGCAAVDHLKLASGEVPPAAIGCWKCHGGLALGGPAPRPGGMQYVRPRVYDEELTPEDQKKPS